ncbi:simple sugar transport system ATP-binding protein [Paenibacillus endophyticus]|uniref:Simple sugar transport system ATP-binding protein n=1 Tax=Paenibacillus endophyticus TaxID=1294268 RepID=A0A7W5C475_9BACL|nr:sugar ABC transporter ATP-binding protein [Paenibacillus endophyticus]MBB3150435.1 simple sugar transport system ATP-binding protein [Paenibacillus endophyticus]
MKKQNPILDMRGIHKYFTGVKALQNVNFRLFPGEVHALMGENGAGKSTLIKVLTGVHEIDEGTVVMEGNSITISNPLEAQEAGITTVYQEVNLCSNLSVAENIFIGREPRRFGRILWKEMNRQAAQLLKERLNLSINVTLPLDAYSVAVQQLVAIARALNISAKVLILDEPTSSLDASEVRELFTVMRKLKAQGLAILFVTHFLDQVYEVSDRISILRGGEFVGEYLASELPRIDLVLKMIGKDLELLAELPQTGSKELAKKGEAFLQAKGLGKKGAIEPYDLQIDRGEIIGFAGLLGSGRTETARLLFGADRVDSGGLQIAGKTLKIESPRQAISEGIAFCSENRKTEGIIADLTVRENIILALQASRGWFRTISRKRQDEIADEYIKALNINPKNPEQLIRNLSGGNQQKVLLARWLLMEPKLLILDEPTRGIDIGAKAEIQKLVLALSRKGMSVLFISSELEEVLRVSDRVAVLRDRKLVRMMQADELSHENVMKAIAGG